MYDLDRGDARWGDYRQEAVGTQFNYNQGNVCYSGSRRLFGLSATEVPDLAVVPITQTYQPFGVGGVISPNDGTSWLRHSVVIPHYAGMIAGISPTQASAMWEWLEAEALFTPLNDVESLMVAAEPTCGQIAWKALKGSWNLSLQTLGWCICHPRNCARRARRWTGSTRRWVETVSGRSIFAPILFSALDLLKDPRVS